MSADEWVTTPVETLERVDGPGWVRVDGLGFVRHELLPPLVDRDPGDETEARP